MRNAEATIREATPDDAETLASLIRDSFRDVAQRFHLTPESAPTHPSFCLPEWVLKDFAGGGRYRLLEEGDAACGCVGLYRLSDDAFEIRRLAVLPRYRGRGFGSMLLRHAEETARREGATLAKLYIIADHHELQAWYEKRGYALIETKSYSHLPFAVAALFKAMQ